MLDSGDIMLKYPFSGTEKVSINDTNATKTTAPSNISLVSKPIRVNKPGIVAKSVIALRRMKTHKLPQLAQVAHPPQKKSTGPPTSHQLPAVENKVLSRTSTQDSITTPTELLPRILTTIGNDELDNLEDTLPSIQPTKTVELRHSQINKLPHLSAELAKKQVDQYFWSFFRTLEHLTNPNKLEEPTAASVKIDRDLIDGNIDDFLKFCSMHADYEKKRQIFYAMCARKTVKQRQLDLLILDRNSYEERAQFVMQLLNTAENNTAKRNIVVCFEELMKKFRSLSFQQCSLKCRENAIKQQLMANCATKTNLKSAVERLDYVNWEIKREEHFSSCLDSDFPSLLKDIC